MMTLRNYARLPSISNGYELDDVFSVVVPIARTNLVTNPSFETNTTSWTAIGGSIARSTLFQYHGAYSLGVTPTAATTDGARFDTVSLTAGQLYAYSAKVLGSAGRSYKLAIETTGAVELASVTFVATGRWQWVFGYYAENSTTTRRVTLRKAGGTDVLVFYLDGVQVEALSVGESASTYLDGDQTGFVPNQSPVAYYWTGTPHASTSARSGLTRSGGMVIPFKQFGFLLIAIVGLGLAPPANIVTEYARIDGGYDSYTRKPSRQFTLSGQFQAGLDYLQLRQQRGGLAHLLDRDLVGQDQRLMLLREVVDPCGVSQSSVCQVVGKYQGGLQGNTDNQVAEQAAITFTQYLPNVLADGESGVALSTPSNVANANYIAMRTPAGVWQALSTGLTGGLARCVLAMPDGSVIVGGDFTGAGGVANTNGIARYTPSTNLFSAIGTGVSGGVVYNLATDPAGTAIYAVGTFTLAGGVASTKFAAKNIAGVWSPLGAGFTLGTGLFAVIYASPTAVYVAGDITTAAGVVQYNPTSNTLVGTLAASGTQIRTLALSADLNILYIGGTITAITAVTVANIGAINLTTAAVNTMAGGVNTTVDSIVLGPNGLIYAGGLFVTSTAGATLNRVGMFNGVYWAPLGTGMNAEVSRVALAPDGSIWATGLFTTANGFTLLGGVAIWAQGTWTFPDFVIPGTADCRAITFLSDGSVYLGFNSSGTGVQGTATVLTNAGSANVYPTFRMNGPVSGTAALYMILNRTNNRVIYFNYSLQPGEVLLLTLTPDHLSFVSNERGSIMFAVRPGSNLADFFLSPGANNVAFYAGSITIDSYWRAAYVTLDDVP